jgi:hypothetical protein
MYRQIQHLKNYQYFDSSLLYDNPVIPYNFMIELLENYSETYVQKIRFVFEKLQKI